ncbi:MAG: hypothetical protein RSF33_02480 [Hydrogenoanaerobacterium sp.]
MRLTAKNLNGYRIALPSPVSLCYNSAYDIPADALDAMFTATSLQNTGELVTLTMELENKIIFDGPIDEQELVKNENGVFLKLRARSKASVLLDNEAIPQTLYRPNLTDIYNTVCRQYGFLGLLYDKNPKLSSFTVAKGQSEWQALESFCRQTLELRPFIQNDYIVAKKRQAAQKLLISNNASGGLKYMSMTVRNKRYGVISKVILKSSTTKLYDTAVYNPLFNELRIKRKRYIAPPKDWVGNPRRGADRLMRDSMTKKVQIFLVLPGLVVVYPGDLVHLDDAAAASLGREFTVFDVCYTANANTAVTKITLVLPEYL